MAKFRTCEFCGDNLDHGEQCRCREKGADQAAGALEAAAQEGIRAEVAILLEKKAGEDLFRRKIEATSASAALNGIAILIAEYSKLTDVPVVRVLALLAATMTASGIRAEQAEQVGMRGEV